jgi:uncharacterized protein (DUF2252 family)
MTDPDQHALRTAFLTPRPSRAERRARGAAARATVPPAAHEELRTEGRHPLALLTAQEGVREPALVPIRYERMAASPFAFLRGAAAVMADDLSRTPTTPVTIQLCGDAHVANFGMFASPDRRLVFDLNDFDETHGGPFEWDVKRLAASVVVAARHRELKPKQRRAAARATVAAYRTAMAELATAPTLNVWYARLDVDTLLDAVRGTSLAGDAKRAGKASSRNTGDVAVGKLTTMVDGRRRFRSSPPLLVPIDETLAPGVVDAAADVFRRYLASLPADRAVLLLRYSFLDLAHKVVGVGSVGTRALLLLLESGDGEPLVLQLKQANPSVLEPYVAAARIGEDEVHHGRRVAVGQRLLQATGDPFLGWTRGGELAPYDFYVRQLRDMKGSFDLERLTAEDLVLYGRLCGAVLARAHARAGDASTIAGYLGDDDSFDVAVAAFAERYADLTDADHASLVAARRAGTVATGVPA